MSAKYYTDVFVKAGFEFSEHQKPFDVWIRGDEKLFHCMPCMRFKHIKGDEAIKDVRMYPHQVRKYVSEL